MRLFELKRKIPKMWKDEDVVVALKWDTKVAQSPVDYLQVVDTVYYWEDVRRYSSTYCKESDHRRTVDFKYATNIRMAAMDWNNWCYV